MQINTNDLLTSCDFGAHHRAQPDAAQAQDYDAVVGTGVGSIDNGASAGLDATAQRREKLQLFFGYARDVDNRVFPGDSPVGEAGLTEKFTVDIKSFLALA